MKIANGKPCAAFQQTPLFSPIFSSHFQRFPIGDSKTKEKRFFFQAFATLPASVIYSVRSLAWNCWKSARFSGFSLLFPALLEFFPTDEINENSINSSKNH